MIKSCLNCEKEYKVKPAKYKASKFCSRICKDINLKGKPAWNKGIKRWWFSPTEYKKGHQQTQAWYEIMRSRKGDKIWNWKGGDVGYIALHTWLKRELGKASYCSFNPIHTSYRFEWANVSGAYLRDLGDYTQLCVKCHRNYDMIRRGEINYVIR